MKHAIEVVHLVNGEVISVQTLSRRRERREVAAAVGFVALLFVAAMGIVAGVSIGAHRVLYGPAYLLVWAGAAALVGFLLGRRALRRARRYSIGAGIDSDAFANDELDLVRRTRAGYELALMPGMTGTVAGGRAPVPVESLAGSRGTRFELGAGARAEIFLGATTFVVNVDGGRVCVPRVGMAFFKRFARPALTAVQLTAVASLLSATPAGASFTEADMRSAIPPTATPWESEKLLRKQAQGQSRTLHRCFDVMPLACQRPGYVAVGVSLSRQGEIRSNWIARSTFGGDCPVDQCMADVISTWFFEPLPEPMRVVLPVQVLRTEKPMPTAALN